MGLRRPIFGRDLCCCYTLILEKDQVSVLVHNPERRLCYTEPMFRLREKILEQVNQFFKPKAFGLDISDHSLKCLQISLHNTMEVGYFGEMEIPDNVITSGEIKNEGELIKIMRGWFAREKRKIGSRFVIASLPEEKSFVRLIQVPKIKKEDIANAIRWEIEANIPLSIDEALYDYEVIEPPYPAEDHLDVIITAFPKKIVESYVRVLEGAGLIPLALELESQAIIRSIIPELETHQAGIVVDIGRERTSFTIFSDGIIFTTTIELGGIIFEENIAKALNVNLEKADAIKKAVGMDKAQHDGKVFQALVPALNAIADELRSTVEYYQTHTAHTHGGGNTISRVFLVGGDANLLGIDTYLSSALKIPVCIAWPFAAIRDRMRSVAPPLPHNESLAYATAIGLALRDLW